MITGKHAEEMEVLKQTISDKDREISSLNTELDRLKKELDDIKRERYAVISECAFEIDFKGINAFSIERMERPIVKGETFQREVTNIGYTQEGIVKEWIFYCSRDTHEKIAGQFRDFLRMKNQA